MNGGVLARFRLAESDLIVEQISDDLKTYLFSLSSDGGTIAVPGRWKSEGDQLLPGILLYDFDNLSQPQSGFTFFDTYKGTSVLSLAVAPQGKWTCVRINGSYDPRRRDAIAVYSNSGEQKVLELGTGWLFLHPQGKMLVIQSDGTISRSTAFDRVSGAGNGDGDQ